MKMTVTTMVKAWEIAHLMIDGLQFDTERTERGSGKTWSKPGTNATVIDLGLRLEVNDENGDTLNIWVEPKSDEDFVASTAQPIINEDIKRLTFAVMGTDYGDETERRLYNALGAGHDWRFDDNSLARLEAYSKASDFIVAWCNHNGGWGKKWGSVSVINLTHYAHGSGNGHYIITALVTTVGTND